MADEPDNAWGESLNAKLDADFTGAEVRIRLECLALAVNAKPHLSERYQVTVAVAYLAFITGASDKTPRQIILDALDAAKVA